MVGFIRGFLGSKKTNRNGIEGNEQIAGSANQASPSEKASQAYFLSSDEAKTLGDIEYMRAAKAVRRTYPKTLANQNGYEEIKQISALQDIKLLDQLPVTDPVIEAPANSATSYSASSKPVETTEARPQTADGDINMFRNMARNMNKPRR